MKNLLNDGEKMMLKTGRLFPKLMVLLDKKFIVIYAINIYLNLVQEKYQDFATD